MLIYFENIHQSKNWLLTNKVRRDEKDSFQKDFSNLQNHEYFDF